MSLPLISGLRRLPMVVLGAVLGLVLSACDSNDPAAPRMAPGALKTGRFVDHPVEGLRYSGSPSLTLRQGEFTYREGDTVRFFIGTDNNPGINLGAAPGAITVTPLSLVPDAGDLSDRRVTNIARLLLTLDTDCEPSNGILISSTARILAPAGGLDFDQPEADFAAAASGYLQAVGTCQPDNALVSGAFARNAFAPTLAHMETNEGRANLLPTTFAGNDLQPNEGSLVRVADAVPAVTDPDGSVTTQWTQRAGLTVTLTGDTTLAPTFTAPNVESTSLPAEREIVLRLTATDNDGGTHSDDVVFTVQNGQVNDRPLANAGVDQTVPEVSSVLLDGSGSRDPENGAQITYQWTQAADDTVRVTLSSATAANPAFTAPTVTSDPITLNFSLVVRDPQNLASSPDTVIITVTNLGENRAPASSPRPQNLTVDEGTLNIVLNGSESNDPENDALSYRWKEGASMALTAYTGPHPALRGAETVEMSFDAPDVAGDQELIYELEVTDSHGNFASGDSRVLIRDARTVSVVNAPAVTVAEGNAGTVEMQFTVKLSSVSKQAVRVKYATRDMTATAGISPAGDYTAASGELVFAPQVENAQREVVQQGETEKTVTVAVHGDLFDENGETLQLELSEATGVSIGVRTGIGTIVDDDASDLLHIGAAKRSVTPTQPQIDGIREPRFVGQTHLQKFNLGGSGFNLTQNFPDPFGQNLPDQQDQLGEACESDPTGEFSCPDRLGTAPAGARVFEGSGGPEHTHVRAMAIEQPGGEIVVFVMLDAVGAGNLIQKGVRNAIKAAAAAKGVTLDDAHIVFGQTHSHAGADLQGLWGGVPQSWITMLYTMAGEAAGEALGARKPAHLTFRQGTTQEFNSYRRPRVQDQNADADGTLSLLAARGADGTAIGSILQYSAHPVRVGDGVNPRRPHADYIQGAMDLLETDPAFGGVGLYFNGPIADASPEGSRGGCEPVSADQPYSSVRCYGEGVAATARGFASRELTPTLVSKSQEVFLPVTNPLFVAVGALGTFNRYYDFNDRVTGQVPELQEQMANLPQATPIATTLVTRITLGGETSGLEIVTIPGEATNTFGKYIRGLAQTDMMLFGLTQNSFGYIIPEEEFNYFSADGDDGFVLPYTGYEEFVSLGPLTAPLLRIQGYNRLFPAAPEENIPAFIRACANPASPDCALNVIGRDLEYIQSNLARQCIANKAPAQFCALLDPQTPLAAVCLARGLPAGFCSVFGDTSGAAAPSDAALLADAADAQLRGCDMLDPSYCLFPFPSDHFTVAAPANSPQSKAKGGTGKRINLNLLAMPRNAAGKPIDPSEWNRNDGYSPGQMILTYVPGIATESDGRIKGAVPITDLAQYEDPEAPVLVVDAATGKRHPVWAEIDLTAATLLRVPGSAAGQPDAVLPRTGAVRAPLIIRPSVNFEEGHRYVVVLRKLQSQNGGTISAQNAFRACRDKVASLLPPVQSRCAKLEADVFPVLKDAGVARDGSLYLAWDFTVASTNNTIGRLRHMRDDAFVSYLGQDEDSAGGIVNLGRAPRFEITEVRDNPNAEQAREIKGTFTVPSYVVPADPSPADGQAALRKLINQLPPQVQAQIEDGPLFAPISLSSPPNRLFYNPSDAPNPADPQGSRYGDGLPDRSGELTTTFTCRIAKTTLSDKSFADATAADVKPARPSLYGHGLLYSQSEINQDQLRRFSKEHNMMFCATDWFGFASGDLPNVLTMTLDISNFLTLPDATQQGVLNQLFLARLLRHPQGFAANPAFRVGGQPVFDNREVYYDGNSQGGITGGVVVAASKDINRGSLGVPGMNFSTILSRSVDFDLFAAPLYLSYPDETDRNAVFSLIQMLWDRSENNGYAHHITDNSALKGPNNEVLLHPAYGDHQVTMWSADTMARTIGAHVDRTRVSAAHREPAGFNHPEVLLVPLDYSNPVHAAGSGLMYWDEPWDNQGGNDCHNFTLPPPPIGNVPPRTGNDTHECPRRQVAARCQKSHFMHSAGQLIDVSAVGNYAANCRALPASVAVDNPPAVLTPFYGAGVFGAVAQFFAELHEAITAFVAGNFAAAAIEFQTALTNFAGNLASNPELGADPRETIVRTLSANREVEPVILTGDRLIAWSVPPAVGAPYPYPSGVGLSSQCSGDLGKEGSAFCEQLFTGVAPVRDAASLGEVRDAHNGVMLYPAAGSTLAPMGVETSRIAAYKFEDGQFIEVPVQVDQRFPYFLANNRSGFSFYSGTDEELSYQWDVERWQDLDPNETTANYSGARGDPVTGLDHDDEVAFMATDAGSSQAPPGAIPADAAFDSASGLQEVVLTDPLALDLGGQQPNAPRFIYLGLKRVGATSVFHGTAHYVNYDRDANANQWIDRHFYRDDAVNGLDPDPERLGNSNSGYGPNRAGKVQPGAGYYDNPGACTGEGPARVCNSSDRFPRDGLTVTTDSYLWRATGRWMVREISVAKPGQPGVYGDDLIDRWKGRAFQQSPDSNISVVGFEDEQVNWEGNATLLGERCGPVRCMREVWGADSGTNVTKTETFYRDAVSYRYRYRIRVHPIPPDGLYTAWDYNRGAMISTDPAVPGGRYYTALRPQGVPIDGVNDDVGQVDGFSPVAGQCPSLKGPRPPDSFGRCPAFFDAADPTFNLPLAFGNWEQISGKGNTGSLVYTFEIKGATSLLSPLVVPYYRDDACLDDGTGDDPVQRPWPGESVNDSRVTTAYARLAGKASYAEVSCAEKQGAYASHGVHYFVTGDTDNAFLFGKPSTEVDGQQWQFMVPTAAPQNVGETYANVIRAPLQALVVSRPGAPAVPGDNGGGVAGLLTGFAADLQAMGAAFMGADLLGALDAMRVALFNLSDAFLGLLYENGGNGSVAGTLGQVAGASSPGEAAGKLTNSAGDLLFGTDLSPGFKAGVGVVDMTPDVGYGAGQYADKSPDTPDGEMDPYATHKTQKKSYGVQSRLTARAIVIEGSNGKRIALLKTDNYLAQDLLLRRVGQILDQGRSGIAYEQILHHVTHNHSSSYSSTLSAGVWVFEDAYDARFFENQARKMAAAIELAAQNLQAAQMGATQIKHTIFKGNIIRPSRSDDGTPAGYPKEFGDHQVAVLRFENLNGDPIAVWVNHGEHPEGSDGMDLHSADFLGPLERFVEQGLGAPLVFSQGDVGSSETSGNENQRIANDGTVCGTRTNKAGCAFGEGVVRDWNHKEFAQTERNVRFLADDIVRAWDSFDGDSDPRTPEPLVPLTRAAPVEYLTYWVPGPLSHPYPSVSNCRTEPTVEGDTGAPVLGFPDCERPGFPGDNPINAQVAMIYNTLKQEGAPVPEHYDAPAFGAVEENARLMLQAFKLGDVLLASCACEVQNDVVLNLESRTNASAGDIYDGFDWACLIPEFKNQNGPNGEPWAAACERQLGYFNPAEFSNGFEIHGGATNRNPAAIAHMRHQVHNDAAGWDAPENAPNAPGEAADPTQIKGNFTKQEIQDLRMADGGPVPGFKLPIAVGHAGDYNGYTVSYREYMNRDSYRKALTAYGPHTADYMATRLTRMAAILQGAPSTVLVPEVHEPAAIADELRQEALARAAGLATSQAYDAFHAALNDDLGPAEPLAQPASIQRFNAANFRWRGGATAVDNPRVRMQREFVPGSWLDAYDMSGEVQTRVQWPSGPGVAQAHAGQFSWVWTANFEAYSAFPARLGATPAGNYRFCVNGASRKNRAALAYAFCSTPFAVQPWNGVPIQNVAVNSGNVAFQVGAINYPRTPATASFPLFIADNNDLNVCNRCSFRPWAAQGQFNNARVRVTRAGGSVQTITASCTAATPAVCAAATNLGAGDRAVVQVFDQDNNIGEATVP